MKQYGRRNKERYHNRRWKRIWTLLLALLIVSAADPAAVLGEEAQERIYADVVSDLRADGDRVIHLTRDVELPATSFGSGTKTIYGNGHTLYFTACGDMLELDGPDKRLIMNDCVLNGERATAPYGIFGNQLAVAMRGAVIEANRCTFTGNRSGSSVTAGSNAGLASSDNGRVYAAFCTFRDSTGYGMLVNRLDSDTRAHDGYGEAYGCVFRDIKGAGFATTLGAGKVSSCTFYSCDIGCDLNGRPDTVAGCVVYHCGTGVRCRGEGVTVSPDASNGNAQTRIQGNDVGLDLYNGAKADIMFSFVSAGGVGNTDTNVIVCHDDSAAHLYFSRVQGYHDDYYYRRYADLQSSLGGAGYLERLLALRRHWAEYGMAEGRTAGTDLNGGRAGSGICVYDRALARVTGSVDITDCRNGVFVAGGTVDFAESVNAVHNVDCGVYQNGGNFYANAGNRIYACNGIGWYLTGGYGHLNGAEIRGCNREGIYVARGTAGMIDGNVCDNNRDSRFGSGVCVAADGHFAMSGGSIRANGGDGGRGIENHGASGMAGGSITEEAYGIVNYGKFHVTCGGFDAGHYADTNTDLRDCYGYDDFLLYLHWLQHGICQGRTAGRANNSLVHTAWQAIWNQGDFTARTGSYHGDGSYDVYQDGDFHVGGDAAGWGNGIYLAKGRAVDIISPLLCGDHVIGIEVDEQTADHYAGRTVITCGYGMTQKNADAMLPKFVLQNQKTVSGRTAFLRVGVGTNGAKGSILLSEQYRICYDGNVVNTHLTFDLPKQQSVFWREAAAIQTRAALARYDGKELRSLIAAGWNLGADGSKKGCGNGETLFLTAEECTTDLTLYAMWTGAANLTVCGNRQTQGEDYILKGFVSSKSPLPENSFAKENRKHIYDENFDREMPDCQIFAYQGWSFARQATYKDPGVYQPGAKTDITPLILALLAAGAEHVAEDGYLEGITLYAVWDEPPRIRACNRYVSEGDVRQGRLDAKELLRTAAAKDAEDGTEVALELEDFDPQAFLHLGQVGFLTVRYRATDGAGNVSRYPVCVWVAQDGIVKGEWYDANPAYVRHIDRANYEKSDAASGALMEDSVWYRLPSYQKTLTDAFDRIDNEEAVMTWRFTAADIRRSQEYLFDRIQDGAFPESDSLREWLDLFASCKIFDSHYRSSEALPPLPTIR